MPPLPFFIDQNPDQAAIDAVKRGLRAYNVSHLGEYGHLPLSMTVNDGTGQVIAGLLGSTGLGAVAIDLLWTDERWRGQGIASRLLQLAEETGRRRNCLFCLVDTFSFQALDFYLKNDYRVFGEVAGYPNGYKRYFLRKEINP